MLQYNRAIAEANLLEAPCFRSCSRHRFCMYDRCSRGNVRESFEWSRQEGLGVVIMTRSMCCTFPPEVSIFLESIRPSILFRTSKRSARIALCIDVHKLNALSYFGNASLRHPEHVRIIETQDPTTHCSYPALKVKVWSVE